MYLNATSSTGVSRFHHSLWPSLASLKPISKRRGRKGVGMDSSIHYTACTYAQSI